jgi:NitT/TauT family transport system substrate-binding protein
MRTSIKKVLIATINVFELFLIVIFCASACSLNAPQKIEKIVIGTEAVAQSSPIWIAEGKGFFLKEGLDVEIREFESGRTALRTMLNDEGIDIVTAAQTPVVSNSFKRNDYAIVGNIFYSENDVKILARRDKGIKFPVDLKGKTVGITVGSSGHFFLSLFLSLERIAMSDVTTIDLEATHLAQALVEGQVDAIATWEPHIYKAAKALGEKSLILPSGGIYREDYYLVARKDFIKNRTEALKRFLRAIKKGEEFIQKNRKEAIAMITQRLKMDKEILMATWGYFSFQLFLDQSILLSLEDNARWAISNKHTDSSKMPNYLDYICTDALKAIDPSAVMVAGR